MNMSIHLRLRHRGVVFNDRLWGEIKISQCREGHENEGGPGHDFDFLLTPIPKPGDQKAVGESEVSPPG